MEGDLGPGWGRAKTRNPEARDSISSPVAGSYSHVRAEQIGRSSVQFSFQLDSQWREGWAGLLQPGLWT